MESKFFCPSVCYRVVSKPRAGHIADISNLLTGEIRYEKKLLYPRMKVGDTMDLSSLHHCCRPYRCRDFLCALYSPQFLSSLFQIHMSLVSSSRSQSRSQSIWGALLFHLWPLGGQIWFSCEHTRDQSFQPIFFIFIPNMHWSKV